MQISHKCEYRDEINVTTTKVKYELVKFVVPGTNLEDLRATIIARTPESIPVKYFPAFTIWDFNVLSK